MSPSAPPNLALIQPLRDLLQAGQPEQALQQCQAALAAQPQLPELRVTLALCHEALDDVGQAREQLAALLTDQPEHTAALYHAGRLALGAGELELARGQLNQCVALDPNHAASRTLIGVIQRQAGELDQAISTLKTALRAEADYVPALTALAQCLLEQDQVEAAHEHAARAVQLRPHDTHAQYVMAQVFAAEGHDAFAQQGLRNVAKATQAQRIAQFVKTTLSSPAYQQSLAQWQSAQWPSDAVPDASLPTLLVLAGWPGAERDQWIQALVEQWGLPMLPPAQASARRQSLNLPVSPEALAALSPRRLQRSREAWLQSIQAPAQGLVLEPLWLEAAALPALIRRFPNLVVAQVPAPAPARVAAEWAQESAALEPLVKRCGARWLAPATMAELAEQLGLQR